MFIGTNQGYVTSTNAYGLNGDASSNYAVPLEHRGANAMYLVSTSLTTTATATTTTTTTIGFSVMEGNQLSGALHIINANYLLAKGIRK